MKDRPKNKSKQQSTNSKKEKQNEVGKSEDKVEDKAELQKQPVKELPKFAFVKQEPKTDKQLQSGQDDAAKEVSQSKPVVFKPFEAKPA